MCTLWDSTYNSAIVNRIYTIDHKYTLNRKIEYCQMLTNYIGGGTYVTTNNIAK